MYLHPDTASRLIAIRLDALLEESAHRGRVAQARAARPTRSLATALRHAAGAALVGLGARLGGLPAGRPAARPA